MKRQRSILSFMKKPSPENPNPTGAPFNIHGKIDSHGTDKPFNGNFSLEIRGTDTPPEKPPRRIVSENLTPDDNKKTSLFSSILHKFSKVDPKQERNHGREFPPVCSMFNLLNDWEETPTALATSSVVPGKQTVVKSNEILGQHNSVENKSHVDICGPEPPSGRPFIPCLKRIQEDCTKFENSSNFNVNNSCKRVKFVQESQPRNKLPAEASEIASKFEWLNPSQIRDANGRRPDHPLYDKRTLYIPPDALKKMSASQKQYWSAKSQYMDLVLFFKVGKFYELYELDAEIGHKELDWKMTISGVGKCRQVGISESGIDDAVQKLVARGYKVGRMEQLETSDQAKARGGSAVIARKLVQVITPSTADDNIGPDAMHLLAIKEGSCGVNGGSTVFGFAFVDCATLKIWIGAVSDDASCAALMALLMQVSPKEIIYENGGLSREAQKVLKKYSLTGPTDVQISPVPVSGFLDAAGVKNLVQTKNYFKTSNQILDHLPDLVSYSEFTLCALGGLVDHLSRLMLDDVLCNGDLLPYQVYKGCLRMDGQTLVNLEVFQNSANGGTAGTLFKYLNNCITSSGKRLLRSWICHPLKDVEGINNRLDVVDALMMHAEIMSVSEKYLRKVPDLERLFGRVKATVNSQAMLLLPLVGKKALKQWVKLFGFLVKGLRVAIDVLTLLQGEDHVQSSLSKILDLPPLSGRDGLSEFLSQFEAAIDSDFPKYQDHDATESDAETLSILIELFLEKANQWCQVISAISYIDVLRSFAAIASGSSGHMARPLILPQSCESEKGPVLKIKGLWHPFALQEHGVPVPNDIALGEHTDEHHPRTLLLTGPNMGGKSTLLRAACLAVIMAQLGSYVPCETCVLSAADIVFTRLGATDRIMTGESTFYIECAETAEVLRKATKDSLVLLDELGRGTSTFDGYAIAYAVFRHLIEKVNCRLLFATHYHPLTKEFGSHPHVSLQHMACAMKPRSSSGTDHELVFLYRLTSGPCPESYGLQVALMAGIPKQVVDAASNAGLAMKEMIGASFKLSEQRAEFSTLHEGWFKTLLAMSSCNPSNFDEDEYDSLFCLWHELKSSYAKSMGLKY